MGRPPDVWQAAAVHWPSALIAYVPTRLSAATVPLWAKPALLLKFICETTRLRSQMLLEPLLSPNWRSGLSPNWVPLSHHVLLRNVAFEREVPPVPRSPTNGSPSACISTLFS